jgi:hypothetical protein
VNWVLCRLDTREGLRALILYKFICRSDNYTITIGSARRADGAGELLLVDVFVGVEGKALLP